jgi:hypothetical protein
MKKILIWSTAVACVFAVSCGEKNDSDGSGTGTTGTYRSDEVNTIRYSGSVVVADGAMNLVADGPSVYEISAPLFPLIDKLYANEAEKYPSTSEAKTSLAKEGFMTFEKIRDKCISEKYAGIKAETSGASLTPKERADNYSKIASCAYEKYTSKPYSIPQLVSDVDLCQLHLGSDWNMLKDADIQSFTSKMFNNIRTTYSQVNSEEFSWSAFYFSLATYARGSDGKLKVGSLYPEATKRVADIDYAAGNGSGVNDPKRHLEQQIVDGGSAGVSSVPVSLRCVRKLNPAPPTFK